MRQFKSNKFIKQFLTHCELENIHKKQQEEFFSSKNNKVSDIPLHYDHLCDIFRL